MIVQNENIKRKEEVLKIGLNYTLDEDKFTYANNEEREKYIKGMAAF